MYNILILTNDAEPFKELESLLKEEFFNVTTIILDGNDLKKYGDLSEFDLVCTNLFFPNGIHVKILNELSMLTRCPILSFYDDLNNAEIIKILQSGATSHLTFKHPAKLVVAKIKSILRMMHKVYKHHHDKLCVGPISIDLDNRDIVNNGVLTPITNVEYRILRVLIEYKDQTVSKDLLIHRVWDDDSSATENALGIHITRLRKKLVCFENYSLIETIWGVGYRLNIKQCQEDFQKLELALE
ncbi:MAG: response regulator transcription factor [Acholeplasmataceae bacterium]|nr:response regulator transcription factor [Acholeplasmataceae bacterium]